MLNVEPTFPAQNADGLDGIERHDGQALELERLEVITAEAKGLAESARVLNEPEDERGCGVLVAGLDVKRVCAGVVAFVAVAADARKECRRLGGQLVS
jgi:hypothetical protein